MLTFATSTTLTAILLFPALASALWQPRDTPRDLRAPLARHPVMATSSEAQQQEGVRQLLLSELSAVLASWRRLVTKPALRAKLVRPGCTLSFLLLLFPLLLLVSSAAPSTAHLPSLFLPSHLARRRLRIRSSWSSRRRATTCVSAWVWVRARDSMC